MCRQLPLVSRALLLLRVAPLFGSISNLVVQGRVLLAGFFLALAWWEKIGLSFRRYLSAVFVETCDAEYPKLFFQKSPRIH